MKTNERILNNGIAQNRDENIFSLKTFSLNYGLYFKETLRVFNDEVLFSNLHYQNIVQWLQVMNIKIPENYSAGFFEKAIQRLLKTNKHFSGAIAHIHLMAGCAAANETESPVQYIIETTPAKTSEYQLNKEGLIIDIFKRIHKPINRLSFFHSPNLWLYRQAELFVKERSIDNCIIQNEKGHLVETINSNLFLIRDKAIYSASREDGSVDGIMQRFLPHIAAKLNIPFYVTSIDIHDLLSAEEVFLSNIEMGIQWVLGFQKKRYFNSFSKLLTKELNQFIHEYHANK